MVELFQVTRETISEWTKAGMPKVGHGKYDLCPAFEWWKENINTDEEDSSSAIARGRYWNAKAEQAEIDVAERRGELIRRADVITEWCKRVAEFRQGCLSMPVRLPAVLEGKTAPQMRAIIDTYARTLLEGYSREGKYCSKARRPRAHK